MESILEIFCIGNIEPVLYKAWLRDTNFVFSSIFDFKSSSSKNPFASIERLLTEILSFNLIFLVKLVAIDFNLVFLVSAFKFSTFILLRVLSSVV